MLPAPVEPPAARPRTARRTLRLPVATVLLAALLGAGIGFGQDASDTSPTATPAALAIEPAAPEVGVTLALTATGLGAGVEARVDVAGPDGTARELALDADDAGTATAELAVDAAGAWVLRLVDASGDPLAPTAFVLVRAASAPPAPDAPDERTSAEPEPAPVEVALEGSDVVGSAAGDEAWRLAFPAGTGPTGALLADDDLVLVAHGLGLLTLDRATGRVLARSALPAPATAIVRAAPTRVAVDVQHFDGPRERVEFVRSGGDLVPSAPVVFGADAEAFRWLELEGRGAADPAARLAQDPTNPWLHLRAADAAGDEARDAHLRAAVDRAATFFDAFRIAETLRARGRGDLAGEAVDAGLRDFEARGYTPELATDARLLASYGAPAAQLRSALASGNVDAATFWAPWTYRSAAPETPDVRASLRAFADELAARGDVDAAALWRARATEFQQRRISDLLDAVAQRVAATGWLGVLALVLAAVLVHLTLFAKYAKPQAVLLAQRRAEGRRPGASAPLYRSRYFSVTERLVGVLLLAAILALAGLARWNERAAVPPALGSGTLTSAPALEFLDGALLDTPEAALARGYAAQLRGETERALAQYEEAGDLPAALNNRAVLLDDPSLFQRALDRAPGSRVARYNLGRSTSPLPFHDRYRPGEALLLPPTPLDLRGAVAGSWEAAVADAFVRPGATFDEAPAGWPQWIWFAVLGLAALIVVVAVLQVFVPRPRIARSAPRGWIYQLLALLVPGSGLADELYGILLLLPWALLGTDALLQLASVPAPLGLSLRTDVTALAAIYLVNTIAWAVELVSYTRRMRDLKKRDPELARRFGMRVG